MSVSCNLEKLTRSIGNITRNDPCQLLEKKRHQTWPVMFFVIFPGILSSESYVKSWALFQDPFTTCKKKTIFSITTMIFYIIWILRKYSKKVPMTQWCSKFQIITYIYSWSITINFHRWFLFLIKYKTSLLNIFLNFLLSSYTSMLFSAIVNSTISLLPTISILLSYKHLYSNVLKYLLWQSLIQLSFTESVFWNSGLSKSYSLKMVNWYLFIIPFLL